MTTRAPLTPSSGALVLPTGAWRTVWTWKDHHLDRLRQYDNGTFHFSLGLEPDNVEDRNAILVYDKIGPLGYLGAPVARWLARPVNLLPVPVLVQASVWTSRGEPSAHVSIAGRNTVLAMLRSASDI